MDVQLLSAFPPIPLGVSLSACPGVSSVCRLNIHGPRLMAPWLFFVKRQNRQTRYYRKPWHSAEVQGN
jgi:hypothetical protein